MKKLFCFILLATIVSCSKKDTVETTSVTNYQIRVAAESTDGSKNYTSISRVKSGKVAVEFETADATDIKDLAVEVSTDGLNFSKVKSIPIDVKNPNKLYSDTLILK